MRIPVLFHLLFWLPCIGYLVHAQSPDSHKPGTYEDSDGRFFVNRALPVYLNFSTSPDGKENAHQLKSKASAEYTNPMYFDTEGLNTIRSPYAVDQKTKETVYPLRDIVFEVYADGLAPNISHRFYGAPKYQRGGTVYFGKGLMVEISSSDAVSGVKGIFQTASGSNFSPYNTPVSLAKEGNNTIAYYAADNVGNASKPKSSTFMVDLTPPKTTHNFKGPQKDNIYSPKVIATLSASDNLSGVQFTKYHFDDATDRSYYSPISFSQLSDGNHTLYYRSQDNVENAETVVPVQFYLDRIPPLLNNQVMGDQYKGNYLYLSARTKIKLSATDNKAGVKNVEFNLDRQNYSLYSAEVPVPNQTGLHTIYYRGTDYVENQSSPKSLTFFVDNVNPKTYVTYGSPQFFDRDTLFVTSKTPVTLHRSDAHSGVQKTEYQVNSEGKKAYSSPITLAGDGFKTIKFQTTDKVNNLEQEKTSQVFVDNMPPTIYVNFSINAIGSRKSGGKSLQVYPNYTRMYVGATDQHCGTQRIQYSINNGPFLDYSSAYTLDISEVSKFKKKGLYMVVVRAIDKLGNQADKTFEFFVE